jgi:hypothetical protein
MTATTDCIPLVISYLLAAAAASASLGAATPPVTIIDGQPATTEPLTMNPSGLTQWLWIGSQGYAPPGQIAEAATGQQGFSFFDQARTRDNQIDILCAAEAAAGDMSVADARNGAFAVMAAVELMLRGSPGTVPASPGDASMGGLVQWSEVTGPIELAQGQLTQGADALVKFRVTAFVRLTS